MSSDLKAVPLSGPKALFRWTWKRLFPEWAFKSAQWYELISAKGSINRSFAELIVALDTAKAAGNLWQGPNDLFFGGDEALFRGFVEHVRDRSCLEIGAGPYGYLSPCYWIKRRVVIDPLVDQYREHQMRSFGRTFWTPEIETHALPAEQIVPQLCGAIDGAIICQNSLDHGEDPLAVLNAISEYAAPGCFLLFWTDIWHIKGTDIGHRNITRSQEVMPKILSGLGFSIVRTSITHRKPNAHTIEYGCLARKR